MGRLRNRTRDANGYAFWNPTTSVFEQGIFDHVDRTSNYQTTVRGADSTSWFSSTEYWGKSTASNITAVLGTTTLARPQRVRVMYQMSDHNGNTRVTSPGNPTVSVSGSTSISCRSPNSVTGIGECSGVLASGLFATGGTVDLTLNWLGVASASSFGTVTLQQEPTWSQDGGTGDHTGWNSPTTKVTENVAFGAVLPYEDIFIEPGSSQATFQAHVYMKTLMAEDTAAEREVAIGKFKLIFPALPARCRPIPIGTLPSRCGRRSPASPVENMGCSSVKAPSRGMPFVWLLLRSRARLGRTRSEYIPSTTPIATACLPPQALCTPPALDEVSRTCSMQRCW